MAFPDVVDSATTTTSGTSITLNMPASIVAGNLLIAAVTVDAGVSGYSMSGWINYVELAGASNDDTLMLFGRVATGGDSGTVNFSTTLGAAGVVFQIENWVGGTLSASSPVQTASNTGATPPTLNTGTAASYLWLAGMSAASSITAAPSGFSGLVAANNSGNSVYVGLCWLQANASSESPGAFSGGTTAPVTCTVAIPPSGTSANAGAVSVAGAGYAPTAGITFGAGAGAATGTANSPKARVGGASGAGAASATAEQPEAGVAPIAWTQTRLTP